jgi:serine/threonine-protein phosphatase PP1 catalytic subunit
MKGAENDSRKLKSTPIASMASLTRRTIHRRRPLSGFVAVPHQDTLNDIISRLPASVDVTESFTAPFVRWLLTTVSPIFESEPNIVVLRSPIHICGDLHGQISDLISILRIGGVPPQQRYLFLGDYVDRGSNSVEVMSLLICLKVAFPEHVALLRGNHESRVMTQQFGFADECKVKLGKPIYRGFLQVFDRMPICAVIDDRIFCVHGGLAPGISTLEQIAAIGRFGEIPETGPLSDMLWSDPDPNVSGWGPSERGQTVIWGRDVARKFLTKNRLEMIVREHRVADDSFDFPFEPDCSAVIAFSASRSPDDFCNKTSFLAATGRDPPTFTILLNWQPVAQAAVALRKRPSKPLKPRQSRRKKKEQSRPVNSPAGFKSAIHLQTVT